MIRLKTFGTAALQFDEPARKPGEHRRRLAVLAMLAAAGGDGISRDKLVAYVWPEAAEDHARHALAQTLYLLRRDLSGTDAVIGAQELRLDPAIVQSDLAEFSRAVAAGDIDRVAQLYTGPFLDGFYLPGAAEFERWTERIVIAVGIADPVPATRALMAFGDGLILHRLTVDPTLDMRPAIERQVRALAEC